MTSARECAHGRRLPVGAGAADLGAYVETGLDAPGPGRRIAIKDNIDVAGVPTRAGSAVPAHHPTSDAALVSRLHRAGLVVTAKTAMDEFAYTVAGPGMRNPYDPARSAGGSSGGSALAVACGEVCAAIGTDTGGSVRIPAAYCGVVGFKPTYGRIPLTGVLPLSWSLDHVGVLGCTVPVVAEVFDALADPLPGSHSDAVVDGLRIGVPDAAYLAAAHPDVRQVLAATVEALSAGGAQARIVALPPVRSVVDTHLAVLLAEAAAVHAGDRPGASAAVQELVARGAAVSRGAYLDALRRRAALTEAISATFRDVDVLLLPTTPTTAPRRDAATVRLGDGQDVDALLAGIWYTFAFNHAGMPAISLPTRSEGVPGAVQLATQRGADEFLLAVAQTVENLL